MDFTLPSGLKLLNPVSAVSMGMTSSCDFPGTVLGNPSGRDTLVLVSADLGDLHHQGLK